MKIVVLILLVVGLLAGDTTVPPEATRVVVDPSYTVYYTALYNQTLIVNVLSKRVNFFAIGYRYGMAAVDMTVIELGDNHTVTASDYWSASYSKPSPDKIGNVVLLGWDSDFSTYLNVKFARPLITNDPEDNPIEWGSKYVFTLAYSNDRQMSFHQSAVLTYGVSIGGEEATSIQRSNPTAVKGAAADQTGFGNLLLLVPSRSNP